MLIWICALHCEAKPVIDYYRLKKSPDTDAFDLYRNDAITCIVSGIGHDKMSQAVHWANSFLEHEKDSCWINLGIAGHKNLPVGSAVLVNGCTLDESADPLNLTCNIAHAFKTRPIISIEAERSGYDDIAMYDMEASAFFKSCRHYRSIEYCQSIKIISDNEHTAPTRNKAHISALIANNMPEISDFARRFIHL